MTEDESLGLDGPLRPGAVLAGRYRLVERIGGGAMGEVFRAEDVRLKRQVAVKRLLPHLIERQDLLARAEREGQILASLDHPGIIRVHDMLRPPGELFLILQLVEGRSLAEELVERGRLPWRRCADIGIQVCSALEEAHAAGVIHRDIKPANILLAALGKVRVADFGIARLADAATATVEGSPLGTPAYAAPEQATRGEVTPASDLYSLCCVLYETACGRPPFPMDRDASPWTVVYRHVNEPPPDPRVFAGGLPEEAADLLLRGLRKDPAERYASAKELAEALAGSLAVVEEPVAPGPAPASAERAGDETEVPSGPGRAETVYFEPAPPEPEPAFEPGVVRRLPAVVAAALLLTAGATAGTLAARSDDSPTGPPRDIGTKDVRAGHLRTVVPADWEVDAAPSRDLGDLRLRGTVTARPAGQAGAEVVIGTSSARGPALLPASLADAGSRETVRLGLLEGYRHAGLSIGGRAATVYVVPASDGVSTVACLGDHPALGATCSGAAAGLRLVGARAYPLGPTRAVARALGRVLGQVNTSLADAEEIAGAATRDAQSEGARAVAEGLREAASIVPAQASPAALPALAALRGALEDAAAAYDALADAAAAGDEAGWTDARRTVSSAVDALAEAVEAFAGLGYPTG